MNHPISTFLSSTHHHLVLIFKHMHCWECLFIQLTLAPWLAWIVFSTKYRRVEIRCHVSVNFYLICVFFKEQLRSELIFHYIAISLQISRTVKLELIKKHGNDGEREEEFCNARKRPKFLCYTSLKYLHKISPSWTFYCRCGGKKIEKYRNIFLKKFSSCN